MWPTRGHRILHIAWSVDEACAFLFQVGRISWPVQPRFDIDVEVYHAVILAVDDLVSSRALSGILRTTE
jgi:hypothetical protein